MSVASIALLARRVLGVYGSFGPVLVILLPFWLSAWLAARPGPWLILSFAAVLPRLALLARGTALPTPVRILVPAFGDVLSVCVNL